MTLRFLLYSDHLHYTFRKLINRPNNTALEALFSGSLLEVYSETIKHLNLIAISRCEIFAVVVYFNQLSTACSAVSSETPTLFKILISDSTSALQILTSCKPQQCAISFQVEWNWYQRGIVFDQRS